MIQIANDGNLYPSPVTLTQLDEQGIAERYDIVVDFSQFTIGSKVWMVNLCEHQDGKRTSQGPYTVHKHCPAIIGSMCRQVPGVPDCA